jgi:hypothetical protein
MPGIYDMREPVGRSGGPSDPVFDAMEKDCGLSKDWHGTTPYRCWRRLCAAVITRPRDQVDGILRNMSPREIELLAGWKGPPMRLFRSMLKHRVLTRRKDRRIAIRNWKTVQQYAAEIPKRKRKAAAAGKASGKVRAEKTLFDPSDPLDSHDPKDPSDSLDSHDPKDPSDSHDSHDSKDPQYSHDSNKSPDPQDSKSHRGKQRTRSSTPTNRPSNHAIPTAVNAQPEFKPPDPAAFKLRPETAGIKEKALTADLTRRFDAGVKPKTENERIVAQLLREEFVDHAEIGRVLQHCSMWINTSGPFDMGLRRAVGWLLYALRTNKRSPALYLESITFDQEPNDAYLTEAKHKIEEIVNWRAKALSVNQDAAGIGNLGREST